MLGSVKMIGFGQALPPLSEVVTTEDYIDELRRLGVAIPDGFAAKVCGQLGIKSRWKAEGRTGTQLALEASMEACKAAESRWPEFKKEALQVIVHGTSTSDWGLPGAATILQHALGIPAWQCEAAELLAACASWVAGSIYAERTLRQTGYSSALVVASERVCSWANLHDPNDVLWGDGAGAVVWWHDPTDMSGAGIIASRSVSDGSQAALIHSRGLGTQSPPSDRWGIDMGGNGPAIQRHMLTHVAPIVRGLLVDNFLSVNDRTWLVPHNANLRMIVDIGRRLDIPQERVLNVLHDRGNMAGASIPCTLAKYHHYFKPGDLVIMVGFGAGVLVSVILYRWP